ncbi:calcineurin subunit B [Galdieria sulphuraria]|uniref:Calcineurin subunit B n=1 Tax=Galdieria sulphuraria TaxID=130081 RepID=M2XIW7_GALSU|nr:calcineurin subunit B [Galdieria sulphuraria]EME30047.1 calcineurin subunit B [Galdieria sulphuraria]|eukprot:XP_005706567.1 calcineurin subunit B [Galdieria sulphuraria]
MGANTSALLSEEIEEIAKESHLTSKEIKRLYKRFQKLDRNSSGTIESEELYMIPELAMNPLVPRIVSMFDGVNFRQFVSLLSIFSATSPKQEKIDFAFRIYDVENDGIISVNDLVELLQMMVGNNLDQSTLEEIARATIQASDSNHDDKVSKEEFTSLIEKTDIEQSMTIHF